MKIKLPLSALVVITGFFEVEAESIEEAIEKMHNDADANGWDCYAWQNSVFAEPDYGTAQDFGIEPVELPDGTQTDYCELIDN